MDSVQDYEFPQWRPGFTGCPKYDHEDDKFADLSDRQGRIRFGSRHPDRVIMQPAMKYPGLSITGHF
jgi:hypothetical protein